MLSEKSINFRLNKNPNTTQNSSQKKVFLKLRLAISIKHDLSHWQFVVPPFERVLILQSDTEIILPYI